MKRNILAGLALMVFAFTGAAFTANKTLQVNHYLQKPNNCQQIPVTQCVPTGITACMQDDGSGPARVHSTRLNAAQCNTPLFLPQS